MGFWRMIREYLAVNTEADCQLTDSFKTVVHREFSLYLENLMQEEKETIITKTEETWFYIVVYDFVMGCKSISKIILESIDTEFPVGRMWNYCQQQQLPFADWEDVEMILEETFLYQRKEINTAS